MKFLKKFGWLIVAVLPAALCMGMQLAGGYGTVAYYYFQIKAERAGSNDPYGFLLQLAYIRYAAHAIYGVLVYHIAALPVFGFWYYFAYGKKKRLADTEKCGVSKLLIIAVLGIFLQILISAVLNIIYIVKPSLLWNYMRLMQAAGIGSSGILAIIATVILAPIGEELLCRGIMLKLAGKVTDKFWLANCIQAVAFGVIHGNWVQGIYACILGLILGYIYGKYRNIFVCIFLHAVINLAAQFVGYAWVPFSEKYILHVSIGYSILSLLILAVCFFVLGKIKRTEVMEFKITENRVTYDDI